MQLTKKFNIWKKALNHYLISFQKKVLREEIVAGFPEYVVVDTTNNCNLGCPLCPTGQNRNEYPKGIMKFETFKKIIDELGEWLYDIYIGNWGEPLLNPELYKMIEYAHECNIRITIFTNLNILDNDIAEKLVKSNLECLNISLDGAAQESYQRYRKNGDFNKVIENIKLIIETKKRYKADFPIIVWQFLVMRHNESETQKAQEMAEELGIQFKLARIRCDMGRELFMNQRERFESVKQWLPESAKYSKYDYEQNTSKNLKQTCDFLWDFSVINWDGGVAPCCGVYRKEDIFGNINNGSFKSIWNNAKYRAARRFVSSHIEQEAHTVCHNCLKNGFID